MLLSWTQLEFVQHFHPTVGVHHLSITKQALLLLAKLSTSTLVKLFLYVRLLVTQPLSHSRRASDMTGVLKMTHASR